MASSRWRAVRRGYWLDDAGFLAALARRLDATGILMGQVTANQ